MSRPSALQTADLLGLNPHFRRALYGVSGMGGILPPNGELHLVSASGPLRTVQAAADKAQAGDVIAIAPGEYNEDVTVDTDFVSLVGVGPRHSVRITGTAAGTATAMTLDGVSDVGLYNLNLEGRSGGNGLVFTGQIRRVEINGCKLHGGTSAVDIQVPSGAQTTDVHFIDNLIMNATNGIKVSYSGGDPCHQIKVYGNQFSKLTADCILDGGSRDWLIVGNVFGNNGDDEPTQYLDMDDAGTSGLVANNVFATTTSDDQQAKFALDADVMFVANATEAGWSDARPTS